MPVAPSVVPVDLAEAALATPALEACRALGIALPGGRPRSAMDIEELMQGWVVAIGAGLLVGEGQRVRSVPAALATDPKTVLDAWVRAAAIQLGGAADPCRNCLTVLHELQTAGGAVDVAALADAVAGPRREVEPCPDCGGSHEVPSIFSIGSMLDDAPSEADLRYHAESTLEGLVFFGAAAVADGSARLTRLGSMLAAAVFEGRAPAPEVDAGTLISAIAGLPPRIAASMPSPGWARGRRPPANSSPLPRQPSATSGPSA